MPLPRWEALTWLTDDRCQCDDVTFWLTTTDYTTPSTPEQFVLLKNRAFLDSYRVLFDTLQPTRLLEVGFYHGAALVLWDLLLRPTLVLGVDQVRDAPVLEHYRATHPASAIQLHYGVDQGDQTTLQQICTAAAPGQDLDLVIDDASHQYALSRATFAATFPFLRPGGLYVLEDWGWAHWPGLWQDRTAPPLIPGAALSNLVFELVMLQAARPDLLAGLDIDYFRCAVVRGPTPLPPRPLDLDACLLPAARPRPLL